jgi:hypothetical protein
VNEAFGDPFTRAELLADRVALGVELFGGDDPAMPLRIRSMSDDDPVTRAANFESANSPPRDKSLL